METSTLISHRGMNERCSNRKHKHYADYGGRGIRVCERWSGRGGFAEFLHDMGERPPGTSIDRIDGSGNYEPGNCRWATDAEQSANRRNNRRLLVHGVLLTIAEASRAHGVPEATIFGRLARGVDPTLAATLRSMRATAVTLAP